MGWRPWPDITCGDQINIQSVRPSTSPSEYLGCHRHRVDAAGDVSRDFSTCSRVVTRAAEPLGWWERKDMKLVRSDRAARMDKMDILLSVQVKNLGEAPENYRDTTTKIEPDGHPTQGTVGIYVQVQTQASVMQIPPTWFYLLINWYIVPYFQ